MKTPVWFVVWLLLAAFSSSAVAEDVVRIGTFSWHRGPVSLVAQGKGFFQGEEIRVEFSQVRASVELMRNFVNGNYDLIHTNADNVIAWAEGQGVDPQPNDFIIFMGGRKGLTLDLVVAPGIRSFADLRGKTLAVDAINTGYSAVLVYLLRENGLTLNRDYTLKAIGGGGMRTESMKKGETSGGFVSFSEDLKRSGFRKLAQSQDYLTDYARGVGAARRQWAEQHEGLLVRYIRALVRSTNWLLDPKNKEEAIRLIAAANPGSLERAQQEYQQALDARFGYVPGGRLDRAGIRRIIRLREVMGAMKPPLPSPDKYIDERFYQKAVASLSRN